MAAAERYGALIEQALRDLLDQPERPGANTRPTLAENARLYHLAFSRTRVSADKVKTPRHFILYRFTDTHVQFARLLHDNRDLDQHIPDALRS